MKIWSPPFSYISFAMIELVSIFRAALSSNSKNAHPFVPGSECLSQYDVCSFPLWYIRDIFIFLVF